MSYAAWGAGLHCDRAHSLVLPSAIITFFQQSCFLVSMGPSHPVISWKKKEKRLSAVTWCELPWDPWEHLGPAPRPASGAPNYFS